ncbi:HAD family hydrolase [Nanoarchaeota archaeon]
MELIQPESLVVWDLHGVMEKGNEGAVLEITNRVLREHSQSRQMTSDENEAFYGLRWIEYFQRLTPHATHLHEHMQAEAFRISQDQPEIIARHLQPNDYLHEVLAAIEQNDSQIVISNTQPRSLDVYLTALGITRFFPPGAAFALDRHSDANQKKSAILSKFLEDKRFKKIILAGDSPADIALKNYVPGTPTKTYLYSHPNRPFRECEADHKIHDLRVIVQNEIYR